MRSPSSPRRTACRAGPILAAAAALALGGCATSAVTQTSAATTPVPVGAPLATSLAASDGSWALVAMGKQDDPLNTFWEAFHLPATGGRWAERTPPDVADNGGLVAAATGAGLVVGFRPSQSLHFSPLAVTADAGVSYSPHLLPAAISSVPDALSVGADGHAVALADNEILASTRELAGWRPLIDTAALRRSPSARPCGVEELTAVTALHGSVVIGAACAQKAAVGLFQQRGASFVAVDPHLPAADANDRVEVLRLSRLRHGVAALLGLTDGQEQTYVAAWDRGGTGRWTLSLPAPTPGSLTSGAVTSGGGFAVLTRTSDGTMHAADITPGGNGWSRLPNPPARTATIAVSGVRVDALAVSVSVFIDYQLRHGKWARSQTVTVAVPYGSSN